MTFEGSGTGIKNSIPKVREREGNEKIHSQSSGTGIRGLHSWEWPGTGIPAHPWTTFTQLLHWFLNSSWHCVIDIFEACKACSALQTLIVQLTMSIPRYSFIWGHRKCPGSHHLTALSFKLQPNNELPAFVLFQPLQCSIHLAAFLVIVMMPWLAHYFTILLYSARSTAHCALCSIIVVRPIWDCCFRFSSHWITLL